MAQDDELLICGFAETITTGELKRDPSALYYVEAGLSRIARDMVRDCVKQAFSAWAVVANVNGEEAPNAQQAHLLIRVASIDGRSGVLADCMLPGPPQQLMRLDDNEQWVVHLGADVPNNTIDLLRVLIHELGHFWGLGHAPQNSRNLMAPMYSKNIWYPQGDWEVSNMVSLYGKPKPTIPAPGENRIPTYLRTYDQYDQLISAYKIGERIA